MALSNEFRQVMKYQKSLRWLGIDMRARWRRRVAVLLGVCPFKAATGSELP